MCKRQNTVIDTNSQSNGAEEGSHVTSAERSAFRMAERYRFVSHMSMQKASQHEPEICHRALQLSLKKTIYATIHVLLCLESFTAEMVFIEWV